MSHSATTEMARVLCRDRNVPFDPGAAWGRLEFDDVLAAGFARLLLWSDPKPLPRDMEGAWQSYSERTWRPGKPHFKTWPAFWEQARTFVFPPPPATD
jgi:hypothetical protein